MSFFTQHIKPVAVLTVICVVVAGLLAATNGLTAPIIEEADLRRAEATRLELLPDAAGFEPLDCTVEGVQSVYKDSGGTGYVIESVGKGNNGDVAVTVGLDSSGKVLGLVIGSNSEDAGIGTKAFAAEYLGGFIGLSGSADGIDAVSGATYSSAAVKQAVNLAFEAFREVSE